MFTAGVGMRSSGACGLRLVWRARKPLPSALRSSATPARIDHDTDIKPHLLCPSLCLSLHWLLSSLCCLFALSACTWRTVVTVTSISLTSFVSIRGILLNLNRRSPLTQTNVIQPTVFSAPEEPTSSPGPSRTAVCHGALVHLSQLCSRPGTDYQR